VKIGPVYAEIYSVDLKKEEITEGKIYSPVGKFAERAKIASEGDLKAIMTLA